MKKEKRLFELMGLIDDVYIAEAEVYVRKEVYAEGGQCRRKGGRRYWHIWAAAAATLLLVVGTLGVSLGTLRMGSGGADNETAEGGAGHEEGSSIFMSYAGPVFPLTVISTGANEDDLKDSTLTAVRDIAWDYQFMDGESSYMEVTDSYELTNTTQEDVTVMAYYPYAGDFGEWSEVRPAITVDGQPQEAQVETGIHYSGAAGDSTEEIQIGYWKGSSWQDYQELLADGEYLQEALTAAEELSQPVTVYEFTDFQAPLEEYSAATQAISFVIDQEETRIFSYGFEGCEWDWDSGYRRYSYFVPKPDARIREKKMLIVLGTDIEAYELMGYEDGGCEDGEELETVSCEITRRESTLGAVVKELLADYISWYGNEFVEITEEVQQLCQEVVLKEIGQYELFSASEWEDHYFGRMEDMLSEPLYEDRVFYEAFSLTIPAGKTATVTAVMEKEPSFDYHCSGSENVGVEGYDMVTRLGSNLEFTGMTARILNGDKIEIVRQNFGFDLEQGIMEVKLDTEQEHYYLEIVTVQP